MKKVTQTINPIHFEDLEPHRFEDLIRQLVYDFKVWRMLDATGRSGSDEGFDARGWEASVSYGNSRNDEDEEEEDNHESDGPSEPEKLWLVQCKREKSISPQKLIKYAEEIRDPSVYGVIFAAACEFSKKARDACRSILQRKGVQEIHIWGKAELEDILFQPKNDHLLFAYFGISIAIRRRSAQSKILHKLSIKRKAVKILGDLQNEHSTRILLRDVDDSTYDPLHDKKPQDRRNWLHAVFLNHHTRGIICKVREHFAYVHEDRQQWDFIEEFNEVPYSADMHYTVEDREAKWRARHRFEAFWDQIPKQNRAMLEICWLIPYQEVVAIDADGDGLVPDAHIYVPLDQSFGALAELKVDYQVVVYNPELEKRIKFFPASFPDPPDTQKS